MSEYIVTGEQLDALFAWIDELLPSDSKRPERASLYKRLEVPTFVRCRDCKWLDHHNLCLCMLPDGDGGYPGNFTLAVTYSLTDDNEFKIVVEQAFIEGSHVSNEQIVDYMRNMGFELRNPRNWTYATPDIYLSDLHDENVIRSKDGNIFVVDCDIRINTPELRCGGRRELTTEVEFL